jgi:RNA polymerase sigma-70 factor (ECF subfamily)
VEDVMPLPSDAPAVRTPTDADADLALVARVRSGDRSAFEPLMRRHNQALYRAIRSILRRGAEIEDTMQETYLAAFRHLDQFEGRAKFSTWLLKIGIHAALARVQRRVCLLDLDPSAEEEALMDSRSGPQRSPEEQAVNQQLVGLVEAAIDELPDDYRQVLVLRGIEALDTAETAELLDLSEAAVKQRLHRAREMLQHQIEGRTGEAMQAAFGFMGARCDRVVARVMQALATLDPPKAPA